MAGYSTSTQQGSAFNDVEAQALLDIIDSIGDDIPEVNLGIAAGGSGVSIFSGDLIHLKQAPHVEVAYEWTPPTACEIELLSENSCIVIDSRDIYTKIGIAGLTVPLRAGTPTKFSVISSTGIVELKINEIPA